jgi:EmrB/QacA subfamily drug resistance transporter
MDGTSPTPTPPAAGRPPGPATGRERWILLLVTIGSLMFAIDSTIVILALPTMAGELHASLSVIIWAILLYILVGAALTTQAGRLGDLWGRGRLYNAGFAVFTIGSALCGLAPSAEFLIAARGLQAVGGSLLFANGSAILAYVYPPNRRGTAFGMLALGWGMGAILGILLGGVITTAIGWRYIFFINIPIGLMAVTLGLRVLPDPPRTPARFDWAGFALFTAILSLVSYGAIELATYGGSALNYGLLVLAGALVAPFAYAELHHDQPMLDLRELQNRLLSFSLIAGFFQALGYLSVVFLLTLYLQGVRGLSPLNASLLLVPGYLVGGLSGPFMGRLVNRTGSRAMATGGILLMLVGLVGYSLLGTSTWLGWVPVVSLVTGFGTGMFFPANNIAIMSQASPSRFGAISGLRSTLMNMGALMSFVLALTIASATIPRDVATAVFLGTASLIGGLGGQFLNGIHAALYVSAAILGVAAVLSWVRGNDVAPRPYPAGGAAPAGAAPK